MITFIGIRSLGIDAFGLVVYADRRRRARYFNRGRMVFIILIRLMVVVFVAIKGNVLKSP